MIASWQESLSNSVSTLSQLPSIDSNTHIIVASDIDINTAAKRFSILTHEEYLQLLVDSKSTRPSIYEMISGSTPHRIFIDIDGMVEKQLTRSQSISYLSPYLTACAKVLRDHIKISRLDLEHIDMFVYTASFESKLSFHIVIDVFMNNIRATRELVLKIISEYIKSRRSRDPNTVCDIDDKIYNRNRAFRSIYSRKIGNPIERSKVPFAAFRYPTSRGSRIELQPDETEYIEKSIIQSMNRTISESEIIINRSIPDIRDGSLKNSKYIKSAHVLYSLNKTIPMMTTIRQKAEEDRESSEIYVRENVGEIYRKYIEFAQNNNMNQMRMRSHNGNIISLDRTDSSYCVCCDKTHDNDNAYLRVNHGSSTNIFYMCYRGGMGIRID